MFAGRCGLSAPLEWRRLEWQDLILGVEATYTHTNLNTTAPATPIGRFFPDVNTGVTVSASGNLNLTDFGTARGRAGYVVGNFLPYGFIGMAVGRASYNVTTATIVQQTSNGVTQTSSSLTAPDKTTPCSGATRSALDWIGRSRPTSSRAASSSSCNSRRSPTSQSRWPAAASAPASSSKSG
jgi:opacity protein-like surface antigen